MVFEQFATYAVAFLGLEGALAETFHFWVYDTLKITSMLVLVMLGVGYLRTYLPPEKIREFLKGRRAVTGYILAALLAIISPFCSCSTIPIFLGLVGAGVPFGMTITFLATSPMVNTAALAVFPSIFGIKTTVLYLIGGISIGVLGGFTLNRFGMEKYVKEFDFGNPETASSEMTKRKRLEKTYVETKDLLVEIMPYVVLGVGIGAIVHGYVPSDTIQQYLTGPLGVVGAVVAGVPIYVNVLGVIPLIESLVGKGLPMGTGLAFMLSVAALSAPQFIILKKVMRKELIVAYATTIATGILLLGFIFNLII